MLRCLIESMNPGRERALHIKKTLKALERTSMLECLNCMFSC